MLPQVLAGLGLFSVVSAGCFFWLERLQPIFFAVAVSALLYEVWLLWRGPSNLRMPAVRTMLALSSLVNVVVIAGWIALLVRYR